MLHLRLDHLSCYCHPHLHTPNIDALAARGMRFDRAFVQSPVCGPSRASFYTGRTVFSHGATWNRVPLPIGELTLGDYLAPIGVRTAVVGKTHIVADRDGMARLGLTPDSGIGVIVSEPGFEPFERDYGLHPTPALRARGGALRYNDWLRERGYPGENPWNDFANAAGGAERRDPVGLGPAAFEPAGAGGRGAFRNRLHDQSGDRLHRRVRGRALALPSQLCQAALARTWHPRRITTCSGRTTSCRCTAMSVSATTR